MSVSERDQFFASQIAYVDFDKTLTEAELKNLSPITISEAIKYSIIKNVDLCDISQYINIIDRQNGTFELKTNTNILQTGKSLLQ